jgi:serine protease Do
MISAAGATTARRPRAFRHSARSAFAALSLATALAVTGLAGPALAKGPESLADLADKVTDAVVNISASTTVEAKAPGRTMPQLPQGTPFEDLFEEFFNKRGQRGDGDSPRQQSRKSNSLGSGFIIDASGIVVTNNHVIGDANDIQVILHNGTKLKAEIIGKDAKIDLAVLRVKPEAGKPLKAVPFGDSEKMRPGDWVIAIGNPFGLGGSVSAGIVSARGRNIESGPYDNYIQTDAAINKGNSGGPTFNVGGEVVGVNTAIASPSGGSVGLAFAIPAETVQAVVDQLRADGKVARGYLGVQVQPVTKDIADGLGLDKAKGALVDHAEPGTPAAKAGLKSGDVIESVNGASVNDARELSRRIAGLKPGAKVELAYLRAGKSDTATVELGALPNDPKAGNDNRSSSTSDGQPRLGLSLAPAAQVGAGDEGVAVMDVDPDGPAAAKGIEQGDIILDVAGSSVSKPSEIAERIKAAEASGRKAVLMRVKSTKGVTRFVAVALNKAG